MFNSGTDWLVIAGGVAVIAWVNWYFFFAGRTRVVAAAVAANASGAGAQVQTIVVNGGYTPAVVTVRAGKPVRLVFDRRDSGSCSEEVVFPDFGIRRYLPTGKKTTIDLTPPSAGRYEFTCGMSMLHGALVAEE